jgi:hypothetical protein
MTDDTTLTFGFPSSSWSLPPGELSRQAISPLRGYAYQLHQSVASWINLPIGATLHLEVAEDYATVALEPKRLEEVLAATQVKDTRESGAVTLNSQDVLDAITHLWNLQEANPGRDVRLVFLTTSPIGAEHKRLLPNGVRGLEAWRDAAEGGDVAEVRKALCLRLPAGKLADFVREAEDAELRDNLLRRLTFACGAPDGKDVEARGRAALVAMRDLVQATSDLAERAYDVLLVEVLNTIIRSQTRTLTRDRFLELFRQATSIAMPSQVVVDVVAGKITAPARLTEQELRQIARQLLEGGSPPSLLPLFPAASNSVHQALDRLGQLRRVATEIRENNATTVEVIKLTATKDLHHLLIAPPGSGKTHALWHAAREILDSGDLIPLYIPLAGLNSWSDVLQTVADIGDNGEPADLFRDPRICVIFDGWSEFASGQGAEERARMMRILSRTRVVASAKRAGISDTFFRRWTLEPLPISAVYKTIKTARPEVPLPDPAFLELLRLPLALSLFVLLDGSALTRGELIDRLHSHLSRDLPEGFRAVVAGAAGSVSLSGGRSYVRLQDEIRDRASRASIAEPLTLLTRLGALEDRAGTILPVHDLYWSWLSGLGLLKEDRIAQSLLDLSTREGLQLALESGARSNAQMVDTASPVDIVLASLLSTGLEIPRAERNAFPKIVGEMFSDDRLPVRCRAALAGLQSGEASLLLPSLKVITELSDAGLYVPALQSALVPRNLFPNRGIIAQWVGANGTNIVIDAIALHGGPEWGPWLEELAHSDKLAPHVAAGAAIACEGHLPKWTMEHLYQLVSADSWKLRVAAARGANVELAHWVAEHYDEHVDPKKSTWFHLNKVLVSCGDDETFARLLARFSSLSNKAQETLGFAIVELGDRWVARYQEIAFKVSGAKHHHQLAETLSLDVDDATARSWIANGFFEPGWRVLIARHGADIVPEMVANLPESFDGLDSIPILAAMRFLVNPPQSLLSEIFSRIRGKMQPKPMQDAIYAIARVRPAGLPSIATWIAKNPNALPTYHLMQVLQLLKVWEDEAGHRLMVRTPSGDTSFREWILVSRLAQDKDDRFFRNALCNDTELTIRLVLSEFREDHSAASELLGKIAPMLGYHAELFDYLVASPDLVSLIPKIFSRAFDTFPETALLRAIDAAGVNLGEFLRGLAVSSTPTHKTLHKEIVRRVLDGKLDLFLYREVAKILRIYPREHLLELLKSMMPGVATNEIWFLREIEAERRELLIDEKGHWLG